MSRKLVIIIKAVAPIFILVLLLQTIPTAQAESSKRQTGRVEGVVTDRFGEHVTKATIKVEGKRIRKEIVSDEAGRFQTVLPEGLYRITVYSPGFESFKSDEVKVRADSTTTINFALKVVLAGPCPEVKHKGKGIVICQ
ncbi:MAG: carboxypeptidase-like regulatory domain-containing protein [Acidobacteriota bacterium]|nr:carboxypeptidase-like regulatory domain-containing protein [Acidobacteriota bacterium]